jgi:hypothetical protein
VEDDRIAMIWKVEGSGGHFKSTLLALKEYGLLEGDLDRHRTKLSQRALNILVDYPEDSTEWRAAVREAALSPAIHQHLWREHATNLSDEHGLRRYLIHSHRFTDSAVGRFLKQYRETLEFARVRAPQDTTNGAIPSPDDCRREPMSANTAASSSANPRPAPTQPGIGPQPDSIPYAFTLDEGPVHLQVPVVQRQGSVTILEEWFDLIIRRIKGSIGDV